MWTKATAERPLWHTVTGHLGAGAKLSHPTDWAPTGVQALANDIKRPGVVVIDTEPVSPITTGRKDHGVTTERFLTLADVSEVMSSPRWARGRDVLLGFVDVWSTRALVPGAEVQP